jgi:hypothetical protein
MNMVAGSVPHFLKRAVNMAVVKLMVAADISHRAVKRLVGPFNPSALLVNVPGQNHQVDLRGIWCFPCFKFTMQVRINPYSQNLTSIQPATLGDEGLRYDLAIN